MALRVLLADESSTIKKVFQLALQDFGVEVRPVNIGVDVATVARSFKPDIIFADVLLQKKNGYDVCAELKGDAQLRSVPVVLMWSGFMELDEDKYQAAQANAQLEKPFDVQALRKLINELVPRTQNQTLSQYLNFPNVKAEAAPSAPAADLGAGGESDVADDAFTQVPIPKLKNKESQADKYRLNLKPEELDPGHIHVDYEMPPEKLAVDQIFKTPAKAATPTKAPELPVFEEEDTLDGDAKADLTAIFKTSPPPPPSAPARRDVPPPPPPTSMSVATPVKPVSMPETATSAPVQTLTTQQIEEIVRQQSAELIEAAVWKVLPELAKQIIERELNKLLKERDSHPY